MKRVSTRIMNQHLMGLTHRLDTFIQENVSTPFDVGNFKIISMTGHYMGSDNLSHVFHYTKQHRIGPVRYCAAIRGYGSFIQAYYKTICIYYSAEGINKIKEVKYLHQFTMDLIDLYYAKTLSKKTS